MRKLLGGRTFLVDCLLAGLGWNWFCHFRVEVFKLMTTMFHTF